MKRKNIFASLLLCFCFVLAACGDASIKKPQSGLDAENNGGMVVDYGDYVYFASNFVDASALVDGDNKEGKTQGNSIFRVKTENGKLTRDEEEQIENMEVVVKKMAGFDASNIFVYNSMLYFTSPNVHKESSGDNRFDLETLFRCDLAGNDLKEVYTTKTADAKMFVVENESKCYMLAFDDSKILSINLESRETAALVEDVESAVFPKEQGSLDKVYYTKKLKDSLNDYGIAGNELFVYDIASKTSTNLEKPLNQKITLVAYEYSNLYFKLEIAGTALYYCNNFEKGFANNIPLTLVGETAGTDAISDFVVVNENTVVYKYETQLYTAKAVVGAKNANPVLLVATDAVVEFSAGDYIFYSTADSVYRVDSNNKNNVVTVAEGVTVMQGHMDFDGEWIYFYSQTSNNTTGTYYLHRANVKDVELGNDINLEAVAPVLDEDILEGEV